MPQRPKKRERERERGKKDDFYVCSSKLLANVKLVQNRICHANP